MTDVGSAATGGFSEFVTRDGSGLSVGGSPFYFSGTNNFWLVHTYSPSETVDELFSLASQFGINAVRTWGSSEGQDGRCFQPSPGEYSEEAFQRLDYIIAKAQEHGVRLVLTFVDNWSYYGGMDKYVEWSSTASSHDDFYTDATCRQLYKDYVQYLLNRTNTYTGVTYKNDPTILMWELANEPRAKSDPSGDILMQWIDEMAGFVKSIDSNHLVSTGMEGFYSGGSGWMYDGSQGTDYIRHHQSSHIDVCSFHLYPDHWNISESEALDWIRSHVRDAHETIGKPAYLGEFGWMADRSDVTQIQERNRVYGDWYDELDSVDADGGLVWHLVTSNYENGGNFDIYQSDDGTTSLMSEFASLLENKSGSGSDPQASSFDGEQLLVKGAGSDIWGQADEFHFAHEGISGDATLVARIRDQTNTDPWAKAGIMLRDYLADDSPHAMIVVTPENGIAFQHRSSAGALTSHAGTTGGAPTRLKLERRGDTVTGYVDNGGSWTAVGSATIGMRDPHLGFAVTSHSSGTLSSAAFDEVSGSVATLRSTWTSEDIGSVTVAGSTQRIDTASPSIVANDATDVGTTTATMNGELTDLGGADSADVHFEWRDASTSNWTTTSATTLTAPGSYSVPVSSLSPGTEYEFRAVANASDSDGAISSSRRFTTSSSDGSAEPNVDSFTVTEAGSPNPHAEITADWAVSDGDGDLDAVTVEVRTADGTHADAASTGVSGSSASGTDRFTFKHVGSTAYEVTLVVADVGGNQATATRTVRS